MNSWFPSYITLLQSSKEASSRYIESKKSVNQLGIVRVSNPEGMGLTREVCVTYSVLSKNISTLLDLSLNHGQVSAGTEASYSYTTKDLTSFIVLAFRW